MSIYGLDFIADEDLVRQTKKLLDAALAGEAKANANPYRNVIDPFSALIDASRQGIPVTEWLDQEKARQVQKSFQNALGDFHQGILGSLDGWKDLETGGIADVRSDSNKIIAEVKNKYNTTKGNHKREIYDDLAQMIATTHIGYVGYYVEVVPKVKVPYNKPYAPPDNRTKLRRSARDDIRVIDGYSFYEMASGTKDALRLLYGVLPRVLADILGTAPDLIVSDKEFGELFQRAYPRN